MTSATVCNKAGSKLAAMPMACGKTVAMPLRADAVQAFVPVIVSRQPEARNRRRDIANLPRLFLQRHPAHQIAHAQLQRLGRVLPERRLFRAGFIARSPA